MKKTQVKGIFPLSKGLDLSSVPGTQDSRSLKKAFNIYSRTKTSLKKRPGLRRIPYVGNDSGTQAAIHWFSTVDGSQRDEIVRVRNGRIEALRDISGSTRTFVDLGIAVSPTDVVTFERFANVLIMHFENSVPYRYTMGGTPTALSILSSHNSSPPGFSRSHDFRYWYGGRQAAPHKLYTYAINSLTDQTLRGGGFSLSIRDGDGDPKGITGLSPTFRGDMFALKWENIYRIYRAQFGYGVDVVSDQVGGVHHNAIAAGQNDLYFVSPDAIRTLFMTQKYGAAEMATLTFPIYEYFVEKVNWGAAKNMVLLYDKKSACLLLSYSSAGSTLNNTVLCINTVTKEIFEWEDCEYPTMGKYFEAGRSTTFVGDATRGLCILDDNHNTLDGDPISVNFQTDTIFPLGNPKNVCGFTQGWVLAKPTQKSVEFNILYSLDGKQEVTATLDTQASGWGAQIGDNSSDLIGTGLIGEVNEDMAVLPFNMAGDAHSVRFRVKHTPNALDADQELEIYGIFYEIEYEEDEEKKSTM